MATFSYSIVTLLAIVASGLIQFFDQRKLNLPRADRLYLGLGAFCGGMLGAKLPYLLLNPEGMMSGAAWLENGKTILTGLAGGYFGVEYVKWLRNIRVKTGDSFVVPLAVALGIGRIGCFIGGCCYGIETSLPWAVDFGDHVLRHPTQIYESLFHFAAAILFTYWRKHQILPGKLLKIYYLVYFAYRFVTEWIRPEPRLISGLTPYQVSAAILFLVFGILLFRHNLRQSIGAHSSACT